MRLAKLMLLAVFAVALAAYAFDCGEAAMHCCNSMPCPPHNHRGQDCCKAMPTMHAPFVQPSTLHGVSPSAVALAVTPTSSESHGLDSLARSVAVHCHAPPIAYTQSPPPLRI